jgi:hypothetical protein
MERKFGKGVLGLAVLLLSLVLWAPEAFSWGSATHALIGEQLNKRRGAAGVNEMYGGNGPDVFNYMFERPLEREYLYYTAHNNFMDLWDHAVSFQAKALARGFISHNDVWGADSTAHHGGMTFGQRGTIPGAMPDEGGYIVAKAYVLRSVLRELPEINALGLPEGAKDEILLDISHTLVEYAVDVLVRRADPDIGQKLVASATFRNPEFPRLMARALAEGFSGFSGLSPEGAGEFIESAESGFRKALVLYGHALSQEEPIAVALIARQLAELSRQYLGVYGVALPGGVDLAPLIQFALVKSMELCYADLAGELEATVVVVEGNLDSYGVWY